MPASINDDNENEYLSLLMPTGTSACKKPCQSVCGTCNSRNSPAPATLEASCILTHSASAAASPASSQNSLSGIQCHQPPLHQSDLQQRQLPVASRVIAHSLQSAKAPHPRMANPSFFWEAVFGLMAPVRIGSYRHTLSVTPAYCKRLCLA